ncbi:MAG: hypothetical protein KA712_07375 [Myxococcales bacterium]|nr:hypothetical protein [Myxococcales bacterium]
MFRSSARIPSLFVAFALIGFGPGALSGCGETAEPEPLPPEEPLPPTPESPPAPEAPPPSRCRAPEGVDDNPATIAGTVTLINALLAQQEGQALTLPCFLESLARPLRLNGTLSRISAQPADGPANPRLFLLTRDMWLSVVPDGSGSPFLELGQLTAADRSIKAEIEFPIHQPLTDASPFERLPFGNVTTCGLCHANEEPVLGIPHAMASRALRPAPNTMVPLEKIRAQHESCDDATTPARCEIYTGVFGHGDVQDEPFPQEMPTIFRRD